jgi:putative endonuclease
MICPFFLSTAVAYYLYILQSQTRETYYYGSSDDPDRRLIYHNQEAKGYTQRYRPWIIVYTHPFDTRQQAERAEHVVKNWKSKKMTRLLIQGIIHIEDYL